MDKVELELGKLVITLFYRISMKRNSKVLKIFSICNLYKWRYKKLGNLTHVENWPEYKRANAGFAYDFQLIDVGDFNGVGESEPNPYFYQVSEFPELNNPEWLFWDIDKYF